MNQSPTKDPIDRRENKRVQVLIPATVYDMEKSNPIRCVVRDASKSGCKIVSSKSQDLPDHILLEVTNFKGVRKGRVVQRNSKTAGVVFL